MVDYATSPRDGNWGPFIVYLALLALPGFVMAFVSLCCCCWCALCKCCAATCCRCCSCCQDDERQLYLRSKNPTYRTMFFVLWSAIVAATIVGFVGADKTQSGIVQFGDSVQGTVDSVTSITLQISAKAAEAASINGTASSGLAGSIAAFTSQASQISSQLADGRSQLNGVLDKFIAVINTGFAMPLVTMGLSIISFLLKFKPSNYSMLIYTIATLTSTFVWLSFGFSMPFAVFARQACDVELRNSPTVDAIFGKCIDATTSAAPINSIQQPLQQLLTSFKDNAQYLGISVSDSLPAQNQSIPATITSWSSFTNAQIATVEASAVFQNAPSNNGYKQALQNELTSMRLLMDILALIAQLANCSYLTDLYNAILDKVCGKTVDGFFFMAHSDWIIGALLIPGTAVLMAVFRATQPGDKELAAGIDPNLGGTNASLGMGTVQPAGAMAGNGNGAQLGSNGQVVSVTHYPPGTVPGAAPYPAGTDPAAQPISAHYGFASQHGASAPLQYDANAPQMPQMQQPPPAYGNAPIAPAADPNAGGYSAGGYMQQPPPPQAAPAYPTGQTTSEGAVLPPPPPMQGGGEMAYAPGGVQGVSTLPDGSQVSAPGTNYQA